METTIFLLEIIGTIAFSISGTLAAIKAKMDILGTLIMAIVTAVGGGYIRDLTLGMTPPTVFIKPIYLTVAMITCFLVLIGLTVYKHETTLQQRLKTTILENIINLSDSIGLGIFTMNGVSMAIAHKEINSFVLLLFVGTITGVGGGILRDVFTLTIPNVFTKHIYALASMIGATLYIYLRTILDPSIAMFLCVFVVVMIRFVSYKYKLSLPKVSL